jgi:hypothetical protein
MSWTSAGRADADPYTRAHFARLGTLQLTSEMSRTYMALTDSAGGRLHSSCDYIVEGREPGTSWWSLTVFDDRGELISNPAQRYSFTGQTIAMRPDGTFQVALARDVRPGNWLPTGGAGRLALVLETLDPGGTPMLASAGSDQKRLPEIRRIQCR